MTEQTAKRRTQVQRRDEAETRLLEAAVELVAEKGLEGLTLASVGEAAGYSRGLPAHYFGSKAGLISKLAEHLPGEFARTLAQIKPVSEGLDWIKLWIQQYFYGAKTHPVGTRALFVLIGEAVHNDIVRAPITELNEFSISAIQANVEIGIARGEIRQSVPPREAATILLATMRSTVKQWLISKDKVDLDKVCDEIIVFVTRSFAP